MKYNVFGRNIEIIKSDGKWKTYILGAEGKKRNFNDLLIPIDVDEDDIENYLEDMLHEWASPDNSIVIKIE